MRLLTFLMLLLASQTVPQTAREYYDEIYKAGGLDRMADGYVCFNDDVTNLNFFIFGESKYFRQFLVDNGQFAKLTKEQQKQLNRDYLIVHGYNKGIPFNGDEYYEKDGNSWVSEEAKLDASHYIRTRLTINWQTLRYKRSAEVLKLNHIFQSEVDSYGRCEEVKPDVRQTADP